MDNWTKAHHKQIEEAIDDESARSPGEDPLRTTKARRMLELPRQWRFWAKRHPKVGYPDGHGD